MIAAKLANLSSGQHASQICEAVTQTSAAQLLNVSPRNVSAAKTKVSESALLIYCKVYYSDHIGIV